ncbi:MAG: hydantoinase/oxoprolinase family protein, partial [Desulfuromusa sp.]|nr:hydantoinase/oxoprolinase family protein [Desulfuromusa sp.]
MTEALKLSGNLRVSADIGGTFTDIVVQDRRTGQVITRKIPSTPDNPANAVLQGLREVSETARVDYFIHGTTIGLNAVLERRGAKTALITTEGFAGSYTIQGNERRDIYALNYRKPMTLVPPRDIYSVRERVDAQGQIVEPIRPGDLDAVIEACQREKYEALAICFLFSFKNPDHEIQARDYLAKYLPDISISLSSVVSPEWREFARTSTTVLNAYTAPPVKRYLDRLVGEIRQIAPAAGVCVMSSNGGGMSAGTAGEKAIRTLLSGPVGGGVGGENLGRLLDRPNLICVDMGGTSFDASLVVDGKITISAEAEIQGLPIQTPIVDIHVIGAGGGSIARMADGALRVGPESAGSRPGPVCYGRGGTEPTVTDANVVLGRINPDYFSGGTMTIDKPGADNAVGRLAKDLDMELDPMAEGIIAVADAKMADAMRSITIARGIDPRRFSLVVYGGAGPLHAASIASSLQIREVIIPLFPGVFSAWGMLQSDIRHDYKASFFSPWSGVDLSMLDAGFQALDTEAETLARAEGLDIATITKERFLDFRYIGQEFSQTCPLPDTPIDIAKAAAAFHVICKDRCGHANPFAPIEVVNLRLRTIS